MDRTLSSGFVNSLFDWARTGTTGLYWKEHTENKKQGHRYL